jgi:hypothetical protein
LYFWEYFCIIRGIFVLLEGFFVMFLVFLYFLRAKTMGPFLFYLGDFCFVLGRFLFYPKKKWEDFCFFGGDFNFIHFKKLSKIKQLYFRRSTI